MILADTSVWIDFFRGKSSAQKLANLLIDKRVTTHPWIVGELMVGSLGSKRGEILENLFLLPLVQTASFEELKVFIEEEKLHGMGLSFIDVHILYSSIVNRHFLWTHDRALCRAAKKYQISYESS